MAKRNLQQSAPSQVGTPTGRRLIEPVYVSQPLLPDLAALQPMLEAIWASKYVTNHGPMHQKLEAELANYLGAPTAMLFNNGTIALLAALKLLNLPEGSEVITTPLTFAATAHAISWNNLKPVFADVDPHTLTLDPDAVQLAITPNTSAIIGVHVYGTLCDVKALAEIGTRHNLRIVYDAAHAFGASLDGVPVSNFGAASVFSFHATKLFNTLEGGMIATPNPDDAEPIYYLRNFGIKNEEEVVDIGINGKMNEVQAAIGLLNLQGVEEERQKRRSLRSKYKAMLDGLPGINCAVEQSGVINSEQYFPIVIDADRFGRSRDQIYNQLKEANVFARKYFYPICTDFEPYKGYEVVSARNLPIAESLKSQVLCLPYHSGVNDLAVEETSRVFHNGI